MNSQTITSIKTAIVTALLADKPSLKISDKLEQSLFDAIISNIPEQHEDKPNPDVLAAFSKALSERNILLDSNNPTLTHVSDSQLFSRHEGQDGSLIPAHDYNLENLTPSWDTVLRLATIIVNEHKRARPSKLDSDSKLLQLHLAAEALEALQLINGERETSASTATTKKDYASIVKDFGLDFLLELPGVTFDGHETGIGKTRIGITAVCPPDNALLDELEGKLNLVKDKSDLFTYTAFGGQVYDVIAKPVTTGRQITAVRYRFVQTNR